MVQWQVNWDSRESLVQHLHIEHEHQKPLSTVVVGRPTPQSIFLVNETQKGQTQWLSDSGSVKEVQQKERQWFWYRIFLLMASILCCGGLFKFSSSKRIQSPSFERWSLPFFIFVSTMKQWSTIFIPVLPASFHDALGSFWLISRVKFWNGWMDPTTLFPEGANYTALDSYLLYVVALLFGWISPLLVYKSLLILLPAVSAWCANLWARDLGIASPASWMVGLIFGFSGLMNNAILEGQVYQCCTMGIPLLGLYSSRYTKKATVGSAIGIGLGFSLCYSHPRILVLLH